jgi:hypothetical protein
MQKVTTVLGGFILLNLIFMLSSAWGVSLEIATSERVAVANYKHVATQPVSEIRISEAIAGQEGQGLEFQLRSDQNVWSVKENPSLWLNVRNAGKKSITFKRSMGGLKLCVDGQEYAYRIDKISQEITLKPGEEAKSLHVILSPFWRSLVDDKPLSLSVGKHTVQILSPEEIEPAVKSNEIAIEIQEKLSVKITQDKPEPETVQPEINIDDNTIYPGIGLLYVHPGDSLDVVKRYLGEPPRTRNFSGSGQSVIYQQGAMDFFLRNQRIREMHFNQGYQGSLPNGIRISSKVEDVLKIYGDALKTVEVKRNEANGTCGNKVFYKIKADSSDTIIAYRFGLEREGLLFWFDQNKQVSQIIVYRPQNVEIKDPPLPVTYIIRFKAAKGLQATTADDLLKLFNDRHPQQTRTHHFRTEIVNQELTGLVCADSIMGSSKLRSELGQNKKISCYIRQASGNQLAKLYAMKVVSLDPELLKKTSPTSQPAEAGSGIDKKYTRQAVSQAFRCGMLWLKQMDKNKCDICWEQSAECMRKTLSKKDWQLAQEKTRCTLGKLISRKTISKEYTTTMRDLPEGEFVVIQFQTTFENGKEVVETITPMKEKDGNWRVSEYIIK